MMYCDSQRHTELNESTLVYYMVAATNVVGTGPFSDIANLTTAARMSILLYPPIIPYSLFLQPCAVMESVTPQKIVHHARTTVTRVVCPLFN